MRPASDPALSYLELKDNRLHSILELTNAINANLAVEQLYRIFTFILKEQLHFTRFALLLQQEDWILAADLSSEIGIRDIHDVVKSNNLIVNYLVNN